MSSTIVSQLNVSSALQGIVTGSRPVIVSPTSGTTVDCYSGHCEFVQCIRRINGNMLINQCILQTLVNRDLNVEAQRVGFYVNTTSCILARARCDPYNPITGQLQQPLNLPAGTTGRTGSNSLQISPTGDVCEIYRSLIERTTGRSMDTSPGSSEWRMQKLWACLSDASPGPSLAV